jgi:hypothetical protein
VPTTFVGLIVFVSFLTPGFLHIAQRRVLAPQANRSALMEITTVVTVSLATNVLVVGAFGLLRLLVPTHTPDVGRLLAKGSDYWLENLPYVATWVLAILAGSCAIGVVLARWEVPRRQITTVFAPVIVDSSAWCEVFTTEPGSYVHAGLELTDGGYVSGRVAWFSTELEETGDRDIVLGPPLQLRTEVGVEDLKVQRVIVAARNITRIDVAYIDEPATMLPS